MKKVLVNNMSKVFVEENGLYQIDFSRALWATDRLNTIFHDAKTELSDVDFIAETDEKIFFVEYKNADIEGAVNPAAFNPNEDKKISQVVKKYYDSLIYIDAIGKLSFKKKVYVYILEYPKGDVVTRKGIRNRLKTKLPFLLQQQNDINENLIDDFYVLSIDEWNERFTEFPLYKVVN